MSYHLPVLKPWLMIDIIIWSWQDMCKEQGKRSRNKRRSRSRNRSRSKSWSWFWLNEMSDHLAVLKPRFMIPISYVKVSWQRCHTLIGCGWAFSHKITYVTMFLKILNLEGHPNCITGSKAMAILLNGWILPIGGVALERICACSLCSSLVLVIFH